jgi:N-acetylglucosaminyldiphosphoundecaprenol N-acetyl-beta-D-mannosaminyltransferase
MNHYEGIGFPNPLNPRPMPRTNILGVGVSAINMEDAIRLSDSLIRINGRGYVCATGVHGIMEAQADRAFRDILNRSFITTPDGMPMVWIGRFLGFERVSQVTGHDYMLELCRLSIGRGYRHFLYGGAEGVAGHLAAELVRRIPGLQIAGTYTPPFRPLNLIEEVELRALVAEAKPDVFWVGLSTPKQERFMSDYLDKLNVKLMVGVGAAFDIHTGRIKDAPRWVKNIGMQWLHRLLQEPRRLWRRYLINNPLFIWNISLQFLGFAKFTIDG